MKITHANWAKLVLPTSVCKGECIVRPSISICYCATSHNAQINVLMELTTMPAFLTIKINCMKPLGQVKQETN